MDTTQIANARALFESQWGLIRQVVGYVSRRHRLSREDSNELLSYVSLKLTESDYRILRRFRGKSRLRTYLTTVTIRLLYDYRHHQWGKWRPSARARKLGTVAIHLETLLYRDGYSWEEAVHVLQINFSVALSRNELEDLAARLPRRSSPRRFETDEVLGESPVDGGVDERLLSRERSTTCKRAQTVLQTALQNVPENDRLLLKMRFEDSMTARQIAASLQVRPREVYGRIERSLRQLRTWLDGEGLELAVLWEALTKSGSELRVSFLGHDPSAATR